MFLGLIKVLKIVELETATNSSSGNRINTIDLIENVLARLLYELEHLELLPFPNNGNNLHYNLATCGKKLKTDKYTC